MKNKMNNTEISNNFNNISINHPTSGMSFLTKKEMIDRVLSKGEDILVVDPAKDFTPTIFQSESSKEALFKLEKANHQDKPKQFAQKKIGNTNKRRGHGRGCV